MRPDYVEYNNLQIWNFIVLNTTTDAHVSSFNFQPTPFSRGWPTEKFSPEGLPHKYFLNSTSAMRMPCFGYKKYDLKKSPPSTKVARGHLPAQWALPSTKPPIVLGGINNKESFGSLQSNWAMVEYWGDRIRSSGTLIYSYLVALGESIVERFTLTSAELHVTGKCMLCRGGQILYILIHTNTSHMQISFS